MKRWTRMNALSLVTVSGMNVRAKREQQQYQITCNSFSSFKVRVSLHSFLSFIPRDAVSFVTTIVGSLFNCWVFRSFSSSLSLEDLEHKNRQMSAYLKRWRIDSNNRRPEAMAFICSSEWVSEWGVAARDRTWPGSIPPPSLLPSFFFFPPFPPSLPPSHARVFFFFSSPFFFFLVWGCLALPRLLLSLRLLRLLQADQGRALLQLHTETERKTFPCLASFFRYSHWKTISLAGSLCSFLPGFILYNLQQ